MVETLKMTLFIVLNSVWYFCWHPWGVWEEGDDAGDKIVVEFFRNGILMWCEGVVKRAFVLVFVE